MDIFTTPCTNEMPEVPLEKRFSSRAELIKLVRDFRGIDYSSEIASNQPDDTPRTVCEGLESAFINNVLPEASSQKLLSTPPHHQPSTTFSHPGIPLKIMNGRSGAGKI
jgi:hypothetical protein